MADKISNRYKKTYGNAMLEKNRCFILLLIGNKSQNYPFKHNESMIKVGFVDDFCQAADDITCPACSKI